MKALDHAIFRVWLFNQPPNAKRKKKTHLNNAIYAFADGGNRTQAASTVSECPIHYIIASWQVTQITKMKLS